MSFSRVLVGGFLALGILGFAADDAQAQYYRGNTRLGFYRDYTAIPARPVYVEPNLGYGYIYPYAIGANYTAYNVLYSPLISRSYYNYGYTSQYAYNPYGYAWQYAYNPYGYGSGYTYGYYGR